MFHSYDQNSHLNCNIHYEYTTANNSKIKVTLRPTASRPVCLVVRHLFGTRDQFFFLLEIFFTQLRVCYFVVPSLTRGRVCNLLYANNSPTSPAYNISTWTSQKIPLLCCGAIVAFVFLRVLVLLNPIFTNE
jgi:hypothetical protein